jgi:hypothetical protein
VAAIRRKWLICEDYRTLRPGDLVRIGRGGAIYVFTKTEYDYMGFVRIYGTMNVQLHKEERCAFVIDPLTPRNLRYCRRAKPTIVILGR